MIAILTYEEALDVLTAARAAAAEEALTGAVVVVDAAGNDLAVAREACSSSSTASVAGAKARTAARFGRPSADLAGLAERGALTSTLGMVAMAGGGSLQVVGVAGTLLGLGQLLSMMSSQSFVPRYADDEHFDRYFDTPGTGRCASWLLRDGVMAAYSGRPMTRSAASACTSSSDSPSEASTSGAPSPSSGGAERSCG